MTTIYAAVPEWTESPSVRNTPQSAGPKFSSPKVSSPSSILESARRVCPGSYKKGWRQIWKTLVTVMSTIFFGLCILLCLSARLLAGLCMSLLACSPLVLTWTSALYRTPMVCRGRRDMSTCRSLAAQRCYLRFWGQPKSVTPFIRFLYYKRLIRLASHPPDVVGMVVEEV